MTYATHKIKSSTMNKTVMVCGVKNWYYGTENWEDTTCKGCLRENEMQKTEKRDE